MMGVGVPELVIVFVAGIVWLVPVAAGVWAIMTLHQIRKQQQEILTALGVLLQRGQRE